MAEKNTWIQKYRPKSLNDIVSQDESIKILKNTAETGEMPHLLIYGNSGIGKTTSIHALCYTLFGPKRLNERVLELNASDERGIGIVREKIINFAKLAIGTPDRRYLCPNYKIIILDEADAMTKEAQSALRKVIEEMAHITRFVLICNYVNQIIEPINSRCVKLKFKPISDEDIINKLKTIATSENISITEDALDTISYISNGDLRKGILILQNVKYSQIGSTNVITNSGHIYKMCNFMSRETLEEYIVAMRKSKSVGTLMQIADVIIKKGFVFNSIILNVIDVVLDMENIPDCKKAKIVYGMSKIEMLLNQRANEYVQVLDILFALVDVI